MLSPSHYWAAREITMATARPRRDLRWTLNARNPPRLCKNGDTSKFGAIIFYLTATILVVADHFYAIKGYDRQIFCVASATLSFYTTSTHSGPSQPQPQPHSEPRRGLIR
jgi:hypothetical protein